MVLRQNVDPGVVLSTFLLDLPESNGRLNICVYRNIQWRQPTAMLQKPETHWTYRYPEAPNGDLALPVEIYRYIRAKLKGLGIPHLVGIVSDDTINYGRPLGKKLQ